MHEACEIVVIVRGRRVLIAAHEIRVAVPLSVGTAGTVYTPVRRVALRYARRLDPVHGEAVAEARRLAAESGNSLRVIDLGRGNAIARFVRSLLRRARSLPIVVMKGSCSWGRFARPEPQPADGEPMNAHSAGRRDSSKREVHA